MAGAKEMDFELDTLYMIAVMKMHHDRNPRAANHFDHLLDQTLSEMDIDRGSFMNFLKAHQEDLEKTMEAVGF